MVQHAPFASGVGGRIEPAEPEPRPPPFFLAVDSGGLAGFVWICVQSGAEKREEEKEAKREPKGSQKGAKWEPRGAKREPKWRQKPNNPSQGLRSAKR